ncbi:Serine/threonine protein kinase [Actinomadura meyerae]|uniref:non-specific serine/threonine protein kinase n=1 Tax=Actinomadura meyerae TaxID=240840 RepID=A0A239NI63_9ACTN|nr:serine/threonine-protein kinase [Actinomadura meyerae]SNT54018.1 Serine/threonine protein kinase [Actinomadura meyerae]
MRDQVLGGRYRLVRRLGEGGMGEVWEAQDETLDRRVAVKLISSLGGGGSRGGEARARFLREARITGRLQHPHIVTVHDLGESGPDHGDAPFLVMELVRGEGLDAKLARGGVTLDEAARWGAQICDALSEAHAAGVMHRDIKPSNIFITHTGAVKVLDFGVARAADPYATGDRLTRTGFIVGTPPYMAPEQARGHPEPASDLYALGCLLFEMITGRLPFQAPDGVGYLTAHLTQEPPVPSSVRPGIPGTWDALVHKLLRKEPAERYRTAADTAQALRRLDQPAPTRRLTRQHDSAPVPARDAAPAQDAGIPPIGGSWLPGAVWLLTVVATAILVSINMNGRSDAQDAATGALVVTIATAWLVGNLALIARPRLRAAVTRVTRFALPLLLAVIYIVVIAGTVGSYRGDSHYWWRLAISTAALTSLLGVAAALTPRTGSSTRKAGYALAACNAIAVLDTVIAPWQVSVTPYIAFVNPQPVTCSSATLAITMYCVREMATRRAANGLRPSTVAAVARVR